MTPNVWRVMGTAPPKALIVPGSPSTAISAAKTATRAMSPGENHFIAPPRCRVRFRSHTTRRGDRMEGCHNVPVRGMSQVDGCRADREEYGVPSGLGTGDDEGTGMTLSDQGGIVGWVTGLMETLGAPGAGIAVALENLFPPIPSEVVLPLAGFTVSRGDLVLWQVLLWTTIGSVAGALALYAVGALLGNARVHKNFHRVPFLRPDDLTRTEDWFDKHWRKPVLLGRAGQRVQYA